MRNAEKQAAREQLIQSEYATLKAQGRYTKAYLLEQIADKFFLQPSTVECIIYGHYTARRKRAAAGGTGEE